MKIETGALSRPWKSATVGLRRTSSIGITVAMPGRLLGELCEPHVRQRHRHRALTHRSAHALRRTVPHVARREQAGHARLERQRVAIEWPAGGALSVLEQVGAGEDVAP